MPVVPATQEVETGGLQLGANLGKKKKKMVARLYLTNKLIMVVHACRPSCSGGGDRKITA
jgi:hypothetical protein